MAIDIRRFYQEQHSVLNTDSFDRERFAQLTELSPKLGELVSKQVKQNRDFPSLAGDMWASLFKMKPHLKELEEGEQPTSPINRDLMQRIMEDEQFEDMRRTTMLDDFTSAIGSMRLNEKVHEWMEAEKRNEELKNLMDQLLRKQMQLEGQQAKQQKADQQMDEAQESGDEAQQKKAEAKQKKEQQKTDQIQQDLADIQQQIQQELSQAIDGDQGQSLSAKIAQASKETQESKEDLQNLLAGSGAGAGAGEAEMKKLPLRDQLSLAETLRNNPKMKEIAEWAGKFKSIARKKQKVKHTESLDRSGMTMGTDVERLLPQELAMYAKEETKLDFLRRYAEGQTMMYSPKGKETLGKGPILVLLDQSGSMHDLDPQSKGFILALAMIAKMQRRDFAVITFSVKVGTVFSYKKGKITPTQLVELAEFFQGGGTCYGPVLEKAKDFITNEKQFKKADILFVTDGDPSDKGTLGKTDWQQEFNEFKKSTETSVLSLLIGDDVSTKYVKLFSDRVIQSSDFNSEATHDILAI